MKRATTKARTLELLERLRSRIPGVGLRSSFIVGFPGETEAQFEELLTFVEEGRFDNATCFIFSPEEGTSAYDLDGQLAEDVKEERYRRLTELQDRVSADINHGLVGTRQTVLIDGVDEEGGLHGRMERDAPEIDGQVVIHPPDRGPDAAPGRFAEVEITESHPYELAARAAGRVW
jgi:ribosomal protein S12 methylthiotransferase